MTPPAGLALNGHLIQIQDNWCGASVSHFAPLYNAAIVQYMR